MLVGPSLKYFCHQAFFVNFLKQSIVIYLLDTSKLRNDTVCAILLPLLNFCVCLQNCRLSR